MPSLFLPAAFVDSGVPFNPESSEGPLSSDRKWHLEYGARDWWKTHTPIDLQAISLAGTGFTCDAGVHFDVDDLIQNFTTAEISNANGMHVAGGPQQNADILALIPDLVNAGSGPAYDSHDWVWILMTFSELTHSGVGYSILYLSMSGDTVSQITQFRRASSGMQGRLIDETNDHTTGIVDPGGDDIIMSIDIAGFSQYQRYQLKSDGIPTQPSDVLNDMWPTGVVSIAQDGLTIGEPMKTDGTQPTWRWNPCHSASGTGVSKMEGLEVYRWRRSDQ